MGVSSEFTYHMARKLWLGVSDPFSNRQLVPLTLGASSLDPEAMYDPAWAALPPKAIGDWSIEAYVAPGDPPPPEETLPYAFLTVPPAPWSHAGPSVVVRTLAVIAWNISRPVPATDLLIWQGLDAPVTLSDGDTFAVTELRFELAELADAEVDHAL